MAHYDVVVLGCGPAGERAAIQAARAGKRVAVVERAHVVGGNRVNWGTIPSKTLRETATRVRNLRAERETNPDFLRAPQCRVRHHCINPHRRHTQRDQRKNQEHRSEDTQMPVAARHLLVERRHVEQGEIAINFLNFGPQCGSQRGGRGYRHGR